MKYLTFRKINSKSLSEQVPYFVSAQESYPVFSVEYKALASEVDKLRHCGDFIHTVECDDCGTNHYKGYNRCKSKFCLTCNHVKSGIWTASLIQYLKNYLQLGDSAFLMTFTIKNTDTLSEGLRQLETAWRFFANSQTKYGRLFHTRFIAGFKSVEVTYNETTQQWHPHIHCLGVKEKFSRDCDILNFSWQNSVAKAGGFCSDKIVFTKIDSHRDCELHLHHSVSDSEYSEYLFSNLREVCKYISKCDWSKVPSYRIGEVVTVLKGKRQFSCWGSLLGVLDDVDRAMSIHDTDAFDDFVCQVCGCTKGHPNNLYRDIYENEIIMDYKHSLPDIIPSAYRVAEVKRLHGKIKVPDVLRHNTIQSSLDLSSVSVRRFE